MYFPNHTAVCVILSKAKDLLPGKRPRQHRRFFASLRMTGRGECGGCERESEYVTVFMNWSTWSDGMAVLWHGYLGSDHPWARWPCHAAATGFPLPLGEGWGEGTTFTRHLCKNVSVEKEECNSPRTVL